MLQKMALFETSSDATALRIFTDEDTATVSDVAEIDVLENRIILSLDHKILKSRLSQSIDAATADNFADQLEKMSASEKKIGPSLPDTKKSST